MMSREILFRAKKAYGADKGKWFEGCLLINPAGYSIANIEYDADGWRQIGTFVDPLTVCQYTGLKDKNDKMIYENDIVKIGGHPDCYGWVRFGRYSDARGTADTNYGWYIDFLPNNGYYRQDFGYWAGRISVVGNYFDNPELSEGE